MEIVRLSTFLEYYEGVRARTLRVVDCIPEERLEWAPAPDRFSCGDLARHIAATERYMFAENVTGHPSRYPGHGRELAEGGAAVRAWLDSTHSESMALFATLSDDDLRGRCITPAGTHITTWKWLRAMVEHEVHHRGQIYFLLGLLDVPAPPLYGLTEPEVRASSLPFGAGTGHTP